MKDYQDISRTFSVERRLYPTGLYIEAAEQIEFGYKFAVHGELDSNQQELLMKLMDKVRKGIGKQHIEAKAFPNGHAYYLMVHDQFSGFLEYDKSSEGTPLVIIDGMPFTWQEVGKMLMTYEGFQIKLGVFDMTDDVD